ncbi:hypothetical protein IVB08_09110 [Bradyrhizobium sp. 173]|uniref:hypothetical protein n=1 Tax=Bradyrhizobium sp. 173 TaxID=2782644 RepID=UPI001FF78190|nr:hypothetical protein [Bradyrhizobium sp. 173]MCK1564125.1 hypothetical protein [Bradyrhizobium sp. 173]
MAGTTTKSTMPVMDMWNSTYPPKRPMLRGLLLLGGLLAVSWSYNAFPSFWRASSARGVAALVIADQRFKPGILNEALARIEAEPRPLVQQPELSLAEVVVSLRTAEESLQRKSSAEAQSSVEAAEQRIKKAISANPGDSFLWLLLYSVTVLNGPSSQNTGYLGESYLIGPREGWVSLRRNRVALAAFGILSPEIQDAVVSEFAEMVDSDFLDDAAANLAGVGWTSRERLLEGLKRADLASRERFAKRFAREGRNAAIPGVESDERPWR